MAKKSFDQIMAGLESALAYAEGRADESKYGVHIPSSVDVKAIRKSTGLTQREFAAHYGFTMARIRDWEQGRSNPDSASRAFLLVIEREQEAVERALKVA